MSNNLECPVDFVLVDNNKIRVIALQVFVLAIAFLCTHMLFIVAVLVADFFLRAFGFQKYSPLAIIAGAIVKQLGFKPKLVDQGSKRFAARMGFVVNVLLLIAGFAHFTLGVNVIAVMLIIFSFLESFLGICVGCHIYTYARKLGLISAK